MISETIDLGGKPTTFESGAVARQATGCVLVHQGDTVLMATVAAESNPTKLDYMPLTTEYRHRIAAGGRIPGSYQRREAQPTEPEILTSRLVDRTIRPQFPDAWCFDTQVVVNPLSYDPSSDVPTLAISAAAAALTLSSVPWDGPVAGVRVARIDGKLVAFPDAAALRQADLDLVVSIGRGGIVMVEGGGDEVKEDVVLEAFDLARAAGAPLLDLLDRLKAAAPAKRALPEKPTTDLMERVLQLGEGELLVALATPAKHERAAAVRKAGAEVLKLLGLDGPTADPAARAAAKDALDEVKRTLLRRNALDGKRADGRNPTTIRPISGRAGWLKRCHGSSLFTRGETQAIVSCTLGTDQDAQEIETLDGTLTQRFLLHYSFPPYCVGEVKPLRGPGRREIGHGYLARRALIPVLPSPDVAPYTIRLESLITESNGSSSMASVCGGSLAMFDAGLPLRRPVAGIAMGLVIEGDRSVVLSDILGDEDHIGDMDFKVAGTTEGVTAIQLDNKLGAVPGDVMVKALAQAREGRVHILGEMAKVLGAARPDMSPHAPRVATLRIERNRIRDLIGAGGKNIRGLQEATGVKIDVDDEGLVKIFSKDGAALAEAKRRVEDLTGVPEIGKEYVGRCTGVKHFGSFVRLFEGIEGLLGGVTLEEGAPVTVRVSGVNPQGKLQLERVR